MSTINVTKRNGKKEPLDYEKIHRVLAWAAARLKNVSVSQVEIKSQIQFFDGITTEDIHKTIIKSAADLITEDAPDYQYLAARLAIYSLRKRAYGQFEPPHLYDHVNHVTKLGKYDPHILKDYSREEFDILNQRIDHNRDMNFAYAGVKQLEGKYLIQDRVNNIIFESPQMLYMLVSMCLFATESKDKRLEYVISFYDAISTFKLSLPTPIMAGVRSPSRQFSSCVLIESDDSLNSINASASSIVRYVSQRAGIGINAGRIRALGSPIRGGEAFHTGCIPFYKYFQTAVKSCSQGGIRGGAATLFVPIWTLEIESILVLKNNRGVEENRVRHIDYGIQLNKLMYERLIKGKEISLFSPSDAPGLYDAFFSDQGKFEELYVKYEQDESIRKKSIRAAELFGLLMQERASTGRIYIQNVDHCNTHSAFNPQLAPVRQSNLCMEITLPTKALTNVDDEEGEIALCTLSAFNLGEIELPDLEWLAKLIVRALDNLLDYQDYPLPAAKKATVNRRTLGIGVTNFAYYLAKNGLKYSDGSAKSLVHETFEAIQFYLLKASNELAKEKCPCLSFHETTYAQGLLPIDTYKKDLDKACTTPLLLDWESLRREITEHGLRNSTLSALMPSETSSQIANATNGIEPPRGFVSVKASKDGLLRQVVPDYENLRNQYELLWDMKSRNQGYLELVGIMQKFIDQAISANTNYDPGVFPDGKVPMSQMLKDLLTAYKLGLKTLYYHNTRDGAVDEQYDLDTNKENRTMATQEEDDCDSCRL